MNKIFTALLLFISLNLFSQNQSISLLPSYTNQSFYSLENGEVANLNNTDWDLAFSTATMSSSIRINAGIGTELYSYPLGDTTDWNNFNSSNLSNWLPIYNSDTNWFVGAFDKNSTSMFDMGWGMYSMITHHVTGDSLYAIKTVGGDWKKLWIQKLANDEYTFKYANLDGTNEINTSVSKFNYSDKNFIYYSLDQNSVLDREPNSIDWDITFTKYITPVQGMPYGVTGVMSNDGVQVAQVDNLPDPNSYTDYSQHLMSTEINTIGYDWKSFDMSTFSYSVEPYRCYFVKDLQDKVWRIIFTSFEGSSTGNIEFNTQEMTSSTSVSELQSDISTFEIYPNPITDNNLTIVFDNSFNETQLEIFTVTGKQVFDKNINGAGFQAKSFSLPNLDKGLYIVSISSRGNSIQKKLLIH
ncbi:MAG: T9SS type A sorting domain-containing protein [Flavobacteriales bacterium]